MFFKLKPKQKRAKLDKAEIKKLEGSFDSRLQDYIKREELREYLAKIEKDERRKQVWNSLSTRKKLQLLRYVLSRKGEEHGKK